MTHKESSLFIILNIERYLPMAVKYEYSHTDGSLYRVMLRPP